MHFISLGKLLNHDSDVSSGKDGAIFQSIVGPNSFQYENKTG